MSPEQLAELKDNATLQKRLAKRMARDCFRNAPKLEEMHAMHQIDDNEMKGLMIDVVDCCYDFIVDLAALTVRRSSPPSRSAMSCRNGTIPS